MDIEEEMTETVPVPEEMAVEAEIQPKPMLHLAGNVSNNTILEAILTDCIRECALQLDTVLNDDSKSLTKVQQFKAAMAIWAAEVHGASEAMRHIQGATMKPKHRLMKELLPMVLLRVELIRSYISEATSESDSHVVSSAKEAITLIGIMHVVMHDKTPHARRRETVKYFKEEFDKTVIEA